MGRKDRVRLKGHINIFLTWPLILGILLIAPAVVIFAIDTRAGLVALCADVIYLLIALILFRYQKMKDTFLML